MAYIGREVGDWNCEHCGEHSRHRPTCSAPNGRCRLCGHPIDDHKGVLTAQQKCPVAA